MAAARPRSISRCNYRSLADVSLPQRSSSSSRSNRGKNDDAGKLYWLTVVEEDQEKGLVKVHYVGYENKYDEWRLKEDIVDIHEEVSDSSSDESHEGDFDDPQSLNRTQFCLYDELGSRI